MTTATIGAVSFICLYAAVILVGIGLRRHYPARPTIYEVGQDVRTRILGYTGRSTRP